MLLAFPYLEGSCFGFQRVAGAKPPQGAGGFTPTDSPTNSPDEPLFVAGPAEICCNPEEDHHAETDR